MPVKEQLIKELQDVTAEDITNVYELVLDLKKKKPIPKKERKPAYLKIQKILKKCPGLLADDISSLREDRI
jgi:hypothetical protein